MASSIFGRQNNPCSMVSEFKKFASGMTPEKAQQELQSLLNTGKISESQLNQYKQQAQDLMKLLK